MVAFLTTEGVELLTYLRSIPSTGICLSLLFIITAVTEGYKILNVTYPHAGRCLTLFEFGQLTVPNLFAAMQ